MNRRPTILLPRIGLAYLAFVLIGANDAAVGVLLPSMRAHYGLDKGTISFIFLAGTLGYLCGAFSSGLLLLKLGERFFLALGVGSLLLGAGVISATPPFLAVLAVLVLLGFGVAIIDAGLNAYIAGLPRNTALLNYLHAFYGVGALTGPLVATGVLESGLRWNNVYYVWIGMSFAVLAGVLVIFKGAEAPTGEGKAAKGENVLAAALRLRVVWIAALFLLVYVGAEVSLGNWGYSFLTEERGEDTALSGWLVSGYWMGLTVGRIILGRVAERVGNRRMIQGCLVGTIVGVLLVWLVPGSAPSAIGLWVAGFALGPIFPTTIALMSQLVAARVLPSAIGFMASLGSMGAALFPWVAGNLAERVGLWTILPYVIALTTSMLIFWLALQSQPATPEAGPVLEEPLGVSGVSE